MSGFLGKTGHPERETLLIQYPTTKQLRAARERIEKSAARSAVDVELTRIVNLDPSLKVALDEIATNRMNILGRAILTRALVAGLHYGLRLAELERERDDRRAAA